MKVGVVTRRLVLSPNLHYDPVVSAVFEDPNDPEIDDLEHYFKSRMDDHAKEFAAKFVEFKDAEWHLTVMDTLK
jgi:hypothetical protein